MRYRFPEQLKLLNSSFLSYEIHDNGGRPFRVAIMETRNDNGYKVNVYNNNISTGSPILSFLTREIFIGESFLNDMTEFSGGYGPNFYGNTILLRLNENNYVYIGSCIYSFTARHPINFYISPVGNNDVPYPVAMDTNDNYYLLIENVIIDNPVSESGERLISFEGVNPVYNPDEIYTIYYRDRSIGRPLDVTILQPRSYP